MNNIEEIFKASLENNEMPYDQSAWDAMSSRLDQAMPVNSAKKIPKWGWAASVAAVMGITALYFINSNDKLPQKEEKAQLTVTKPEVDSKTENVSADEVTTTVKTSSLPAKVSEVKEIAKKENKSVLENIFTPDPFLNIPPSNREAKTIAGTPQENQPAASISFPKTNEKYCEGEKITVSNTNKESIQLISENGNNYIIGAKQKISIELSGTGEYFYTYKDGKEMVKEHAFYVLQKPKADFYTNDMTLYNDGLPFNRLEANSTAENYVWTNAKGEILSREKECMAHLYTKGRHEITLTTENANGCKNEITKSVSCDITYNLLATTGFDPTSSIAENKTFIPYALLVRNIPFEMQIIDPKDGHIVYETKDARQPWTGIDKKTNQMVADYSTYVWKVTIMEKAVGEPNRTYQGLITRFSNN